MRRLFPRIERASHVVGVILTLAGLPAALLGAYAFGGEVLDRLTGPDVRLSMPRMTVRCFGRISDQRDLNAIRAGDTAVDARVCGDNYLSVGFLATIENRDRIARTVTDVTARLRLPEGVLDDGRTTIDMGLAWSASDEIHGRVVTNVRRTFTTLELPPQTVLREEIWISQTVPQAERVPWRVVRAWLSDGAVAGQQIATEVRLRIAGEDDGTGPALTCTFALLGPSLARYRTFESHVRRAYTGDCLPEAEDA